MTVPRLSLTALDTAHRASHGPRVVGPATDPRALRIGVVHLGLGAFHRAHQALYTEDAAAAAGDERWGVLGVTQRSARVVDQLRPQDGLYGILTTDAATSSLRLVGCIRDAVFPRTEAARVLDALAAPATHVVTLTVSEKGYRRTADGAPDLADPDLAADLAALRREVAGRPDDAPGASPVGLLVRGLARRFATTGGAPLTVASCDNLVGNGLVLQGLVDAVLAVVPGAGPLRDWVARDVRFPSTMVDRITPATTARHHAEAEQLLGLRDEALVAAEPFRQWVVEDRFAGPRPAWERAGATLTDDVTPYEQAKLRLLNGTHSAVAYLGALRGHRTIAAAVADPDVAATARHLQSDVVRTLHAADGLDLDDYRATVLARFANPAIGHLTLQVAADGSQKLPQRILGPVTELLDRGVVPTAAARALAAWVVFVGRGRDRTGRTLPLDDPLAGRLRDAAAGPDATLADRMLGVTEVFPAAVAGHDGFRAALRAEVADLLREVR